MLRVARMYVSTAAVAEEVVQETWLGVLHGLDRFQGRSSLRTRTFRILTNIAKTRAARLEPAVRLARRRRPGRSGGILGSLRHPARPPRGAWSTLPDDWTGILEDRLERETLPSSAGDRRASPKEGRGIRLRDALGWTSEEVRNVLDLTETNQRVLLHRARTKVRRALEAYLSSETM